MVSRNNPRPMYFSKPFIDPTTDKRVWELGVTVYKSEDGGATFVNMPNSPTYDVGLKTDHHTLWIDPANPRHTILGGDGGLNESWDLGLTYRRLNQIPNGQFYHIAVDDRDPYYIYGGLQDNHSWMGPSATRHWLGILNQDWVQIGFSDGTGQAVDKNNWRYVYTSSSGGNVTRFDPLTGDRFDIKPVPPKGDSAYRWDWDSPLVASQHKAGTVYIGGNRLFISRDYGNSWTATKDLTKQINRDTLMLGGILDKDVKISKNDGDAISEITAIAESPLDMKVLWVGTDDGNVQLSTDGGASWTELSTNIRGVPGLPFVARIVASSANKGTALVAFDQHRSGDFAPYIVRTTDFGKTWRPVVNGLAPDASVRSIYEYPGRANVVFAGTERAFYISRDSGSTWSRLKANLPTTRYDDMLIHPRTHDLVIATHGRSLWILDDASVLADLCRPESSEGPPSGCGNKAQLFEPARATLQLFWEDISNLGHGEYTGENPADGAVFTYYLPSATQNVKFVVRNSDNKVVRELNASAAGGVVQRINWDLRWPPAPGFGGRGGGGGEEGGGGDTGGGRGVVQLPIPAHDIGNRGIFVSPGRYTVTMIVGSDSTSRTFEVRSDPLANVTVKDQKAREAFLLDIQATQQQIQSAVAALRAKAQGATGDSATKLQALQRRLQQANGRIGRIPSGFNGSGAQQGSFAPPGPMLRSMLAEAKDELAAVKREAGIP
jgi:hypothetical protein